MVQLNWWDGHEVEQINLIDIEKVYMTAYQDSLYEVKIRTVNGRTIPIRQETKSNCEEYISCFGSWGFIKAWGGHIYLNRSHMNLDELGEDLEYRIQQPVFSISKDEEKRERGLYET